ncbi:hypothetical protein JTE90_017014 [Oedothorax gibbosus]|uniref:HTH OST-type domain-containing protein n=1 Tax=Oedothorax gibbosus TaxID=931172 RepID=A0AAV6UC76_9ARAC|nr:hypothetical protein JTE90_017014 [Oedothorax gibbosus]
MTDPKGSKSNIAARFQNAFSLQVPPPIGVFWDIENCQVPKGKSAITLVHNIRERFFEDHREAEFMCVCDIHKESKVVIQELLFAQVTVVHISATSKNAADDKLKQCMKRFVDTHGSPATLLLISDDVNFASDLSDFRHRHNIRIILIHRGHAHQSLLTCAHEHHNFLTITQNLPTRSPAKPENNRPCELDVTGLPVNYRENHIKNYLQKLSSNCGGKVISVRGCRAIIRFVNADVAEKAKKRMDKEIVFGNKICVNFRNRTAAEYNNYLPQRDYNTGFNISSPESTDTHSPCSSRDSSRSPPPARSHLGRYMCSAATAKNKLFDFPPPPIIDDQNQPSLLWRERNKPSNCIDNSKLFANAVSDSAKLFTNIGSDNSNLFANTSSNRPKLFANGGSECSKLFANAGSESSKLFANAVSDNSKLFGTNPGLDVAKGGKKAMEWNSVKSVYDKFPDSAFSPFRKNLEPEPPKKFLQRSVGRVAPVTSQECDLKNIPPRHMNEYRTGRNPSSSGAYPSYLNQGYIFPQSTSLPGLSNLDSYGPHGDAAISRCSLPPEVMAPVELQVSNLDPKFEVNEMKKILLSVFSEHVMVLHISMSLQPDGSAKATVKVPSLQDAQYAISRFHRRQIGHKRILISHVSTEKNPPFHVLKSETVSLLNDIPAKNVPLIKFRDLYEKRYHRPIAVSELYKMRDAVSIQGDSGSRIVYLNTDYCRTPSLPDSEDSQEFNVVERPYCERHFHVSYSQGWAEQYSICPLPIVCISLKTLSTAVHMLLDSHQGSLPLISFCDCYEAEIGPLPVVDCVKNSASQDEDVSGDSGLGEGNSNKDQKGVPLEHLIACIAGVEVANSALCIKKVQWQENKIPDSEILQNCSPALASQLGLFGREVMDLLKSQSRCLVAFNKFIPTYHHHFGRQCRVADYGFTKLIDLLEAIPHIVQVLGEGQNRQVTLTHRTQIKRFSAELLRILKSRASKQITIPEFPQVYEQVVEKPFDITNYGVCEIEDMLDEIPESIIGISKTETEIIIGIPKREQTVEEIERTKQFSAEVIELMKHTPHCTMCFNKFIPAYHHHFGKQCRVADYGFTKLIELFEAIPDVLEVKGTGEEKVLHLVTKEQHKILSDRLVSILRSQPNEVIDITQISSVYAQMHGHALRPLDFGFSDLVELLEGMDSTLRIVIGYGRTYVTLVDYRVVHKIALNICRLLMEKQYCSMSLQDLAKMYQSRFGQKINLSLHLEEMTNSVKVKGDIVTLSPLLQVARDIILLLQDYDGQVCFANFGSLFQIKYGVSLCTSSYGFPNLCSMLESLSDYFTIKGKKQKRQVCLNLESIGGRLQEFETSIDSSFTAHNTGNTCLPSTSLTCAKRLIKNEAMMGQSASVPVFPQMLLNCQRTFSSTSVAQQTTRISSGVQQTPQNPTVIDSQFATFQSSFAEFEAKSFSYEKPKMLKEYSLSTQNFQEGLESRNSTVATTLQDHFSSSRSTPTQSRLQARRNRVAARFDMPFS